MTIKSTKQSRLGQVWTPDWMVSHMLDLSNYTGEAVLSIRILEPSFGNGAFLKEIVTRILKESSARGMTTEDTASIIDNNVHGIEIDKEIYKSTVDELVEMCSRHGVHTSFPNLLNMNAMDIDPSFKYDIIVANPPYVRVHLMDESSRKKAEHWSMGSKIQDLYTVFIDICSSVLTDNGIACIITPQSWLKDKGKAAVRCALCERGQLDLIENYGFNPVFSKVSTKVCVTRLSKGSNRIAPSDSVCLQDMSVNNNQIVDNGEKIVTYDEFLKKDNNRNKKKTSSTASSSSSNLIRVGDLFEVRTGVQTSCNKVFVLSSDHTLASFESQFIKPAVKGTKHKPGDEFGRIIYTYVNTVSEDGQHQAVPATEEEIDAEIMDYLRENQHILEKRSLSPGCQWFHYARTQALVDTLRPKVLTPGIIDTKKGCKLPQTDILPSGTVVYSGHYLMHPTDDMDALSRVAQVFESRDFVDYARENCIRLSGEWVNISPGFIKNYIIPEEFLKILNMS